MLSLYECINESSRFMRVLLSSFVMRFEVVESAWFKAFANMSLLQGDF